MANMMKRATFCQNSPKLKNYISTQPGLPWHNGVSERHKRTFIEMVKLVKSS